MGHHVKSGRVTTRKPHTCWGCQRDIPVNTADIETCICVDMGKIYTTYTCAVCEAVVDTWDSQDQEYISEGDVKYGDPDSWEETRKEIEEPTP